MGSEERSDKLLPIGLDSEDEENYPSNSKDESGNKIEAQLEKFRDNWRKEIKLKVNSPEKDDWDSQRKSSIEDTRRESNGSQGSLAMERQAMELFHKGSSLESSGKLYDAVAFYRRATQLVPDIDSKFYSRERAKRDERKLRKDKQTTLDSNDDKLRDKSVDQEEADLEEYDNLLTKFNSLNIDENGSFFICKPSSQLMTRSIHFSNLPYEVALYILRWVVSDELDMKSLETFGQVCRGFYVLSREPEIWRSACTRMWSTNVNDKSILSHYNNDWRLLFIKMPRVNVNGAYISKASYVRQGEASFQDVNYRPCYLVEYYRYLRFFPGGLVMMLNTPDDPYQTLTKLKLCNSNNPSIVKGHYVIQESQIRAILKVKTTTTERVPIGKRGHKNLLITMEKEYRLTLEIRNARKGRNNQLVWVNYTVVSRKNYCEESINTFDLNLTKFPPFWFSRVKSYGLTLTGPLL